MVVDGNYEAVLPVTRPIEERLDLDALFAANYRRLTALLYRVTGDTLQAEEVAAEAFCRLYQKPPRSDHNLEGWLYRTGIRLALDHRKKAQRRALRSRVRGLVGAFNHSRTGA